MFFSGLLCKYIILYVDKYYSVNFWIYLVIRLISRMCRNSRRAQSTCDLHLLLSYQLFKCFSIVNTTFSYVKWLKKNYNIIALQLLLYLFEGFQLLLLALWFNPSLVTMKSTWSNEAFSRQIFGKVWSPTCWLFSEEKCDKFSGEVGGFDATENEEITR